MIDARENFRRAEPNPADVKIPSMVFRGTTGPIIKLEVRENELRKKTADWLEKRLQKILQFFLKGKTSKPFLSGDFFASIAQARVFDGSSETVPTPRGWTGKLEMTPVLSLEVADNVGVSSVSVSLEANGVVVGTFSATLYSNGPLLTGICPTGHKCGIWRVNLSFTGSSFVGNWKIYAVAKDSAGNQSTRVLLREIPVSSG